MIIYALVARGSLVLAEYTPHDGDFPSLARRILAKSSYSKSKTSFTKDDFTFTFFSEDDFTFLCMTKTTVSREVSHKFLDELAVQFNAKYKKDDNSGKSWTAILTLIIKELIERYDVKKPDDKLEQIEDDLHTIVNVAQDNIDKLLERGQTLESIQAKASSMKYSAESFRRSTKKLQRSAIIEKYKNISIGIVAFVAVSYLGYVFIL